MQPIFPAEIECPACGGGFADNDDFMLEEGYDAGEWNNEPGHRQTTPTNCAES